MTSDTIKVKVTPKEGYVLKRIVVMDESGKEIEVTADGTFIMPEGKVTVTAIYNKITNPETVSACHIVLGIILLISIGTLIVNKQKTVKITKEIKVKKKMKKSSFYLSIFCKVLKNFNISHLLLHLSWVIYN